MTVGFLHRDRHGQGRQGQPGHQFVGVDQGVCVDANGEPDPTFACAGDAAALLPNYQGIVFAEAQPGYLAGIVAGSLTKSGTIGAVGGTNVPAVVNYWRGYENGAKSVKPDIKVLYQETDPDPAEGLQRPEQGQDDRQPVHGQRPTSSSRSPASPARASSRPSAPRTGVRGIGVDVDQAVSLPNLAKCIVTSAEKKLVDTVKAVVLSVASDTFKAGTVAYNAASEPQAVGLSAYHDNAALITPDIQAKIDAALAGLKDGSLDPCAPIKCTVAGT